MTPLMRTPKAVTRITFPLSFVTQRRATEENFYVAINCTLGGEVYLAIDKKDAAKY